MFEVGDRVLVISITIAPRDLRNTDATIMSWIRKIGRVGVVIQIHGSWKTLRFYDGLVIWGWEEKDLEFADHG